MKEITFSMNARNTNEVIYKDSNITLFYLKDDLYKVHYPEKWGNDEQEYVSKIIRMFDWNKIKEFLRNQPERLNPETPKGDAIV